MASDSARRPIKRKSLAISSSDVSSAKHVRKCERSGCPAKAPICFASCAEKCAGNGYTSRWYHLSQAEHYCNECFEHYYRSHKDGYEEFTIWKRKWSTYGTTEANIRTFMSETLLPYWIQCTECSKWRQMSKEANPTPDFMKSYVCGMSLSGVKKPKQTDACDVPEDYRVEFAKDYQWLSGLVCPPFLKNSVAFPFLSSYFPDGVGMSALDSEIFSQSKAPDMPAFLSPFVTNEQPESARCFHPGEMDELEIVEFPEFAKIPTVYLAMRNICVALWNLNPKEWLSYEKCAPYIMCRSMTRVWCIGNLNSILWFLTRQGLINFGLLSVPKEIDFMPTGLVPKDNHVIIIGAGMSGLAAAHQLSHFGIKTTVLEAKDRIGGRIHDSSSLGLPVGSGAQMLNGCTNNPLILLSYQLPGKMSSLELPVGRGAQMLNGCTNNPLIVLSYQAGVPVQELSEKCCLITQKGEKVDDKTDSQMDFHFNAILDIIADWRRNKDPVQDLSLMDKFKETHQHFLDESQLSFTKEEEILLNFHIANLEYACGTNLSNVSTLHWDQNEDYPQFSGKNVLFSHGFSEILDKMANTLEIVYNTEITSIEYKNKVIVTSADGQTWKGDKVIVTVPLAVLRSNMVKFNPPLPENKCSAIQELGIGLMEKVVLQFKEKFWADVSSEVFGRVETDFDRRGLFGVFYDLSKEQSSKKGSHVLSTHVSGDGINLIKDKSDKEVISMCMETLKKLFPKKKIPAPEKYIVTRWYKDEHVQMSYSYLPVGVSGDKYDDIATEINNMVYFAGEATNRQHPQSVTGAYLSGIREAEKVVVSFGNS